MTWSKTFFYLHDQPLKKETFFFNFIFSSKKAPLTYKYMESHLNNIAKKAFSMFFSY